MADCLGWVTVCVSDSDRVVQTHDRSDAALYCGVGSRTYLSFLQNNTFAPAEGNVAYDKNYHLFLGVCHSLMCSL